MIRPLLVLALALAPAGPEAQDPGAAPGPSGSEAGPDPTSGAGQEAGPVSAPRDPEGRLADAPEATLGGIPHRLVAAVGITVAGGSGDGTRAGAVAGLTLVRERLALVESLEVARRETLVLVGGGGVLPLPRRFHLIATCLGGLHATGDPIALLPAVGIRAELGWTTQPSRAIVDYVSLSLTGLADLLRTENEAGETVGGFRIALAITAGFTLEPGRKAR